MYYRRLYNTKTVQLQLHFVLFYELYKKSNSEIHEQFTNIIGFLSCFLGHLLSFIHMFKQQNIKAIILQAFHL